MIKTLLKEVLAGMNWVDIGFFAALLLNFASSAALAMDLPSGISIDASKRQQQANIEDWKNERFRSTRDRDQFCSDARLGGELFGSEIANGLEFIVRNPESLVQSKFQGVQLLPQEQLQLKSFQSLDTSNSLVDRLQAQAGLLALAMNASNRLFAGVIEMYRLRAIQAEAYGSAYGIPDHCNESSMRVIRDNEMIAAAEQLLGTYGSLDSAETRAVEAVVKKQLKQP